VAKFGFDVSEVEMTAPPTSYEPIPEGEYVLKAVEAEEKPTKAGDGSYIKVKFEVTKGTYASRLIWQNFNHNNPSERAQNIGRQQLIGWATACGKPGAEDTDKLLDKPFNALVVIEKGTGGYSDSNSIKTFLSGAAESVPKAAPKAAPKPAPAAAKTGNPWD